MIKGWKMEKLKIFKNMIMFHRERYNETLRKVYEERNPDFSGIICFWMNSESYSI